MAIVVVLASQYNIGVAYAVRSPVAVQGRKPNKNLRIQCLKERNHSCRGNSWWKQTGLRILVTALTFGQHLTAGALTYPCDNVESYYEGTQGVTGPALSSKLHDIVSSHSSVSYAEVWDALKILDAADTEDPMSSKDVIEIYSLRRVSKELAGKADGWNREHLWPRSYGLQQGQPEFTDLHNLRPADANVNSSRQNKYYGDCTIRSIGDCLVPANREAAPDTAADKETWRPPAQVRGDIARAVMYMAVRYSPSLKLSDSPSVRNTEMGLLSVLLNWNDADPPSLVEKLRNSRVCSLYQHNRNPFVDHPEFVTAIWGGSKAAGQEATSETDSEAWINELHYENKGKDENEFLEVVATDSIGSNLQVVLYNGDSSEVYGTYDLKNENIFSRIRRISNGLTIYSGMIALQNGPADGIALVETGNNGTTKVLQFISYEGKMKAKNGPAIGRESVDIGVRENSSSSADGSLGLVGTGHRYSSFRWDRLQKSSPGEVNQMQVFK